MSQTATLLERLERVEARLATLSAAQTSAVPLERLDRMEAHLAALSAVVGFVTPPPPTIAVAAAVAEKERDEETKHDSRPPSNSPPLPLPRPQQQRHKAVQKRRAAAVAVAAEEDYEGEGAPPPVTKKQKSAAKAQKKPQRKGYAFVKSSPMTKALQDPKFKGKILPTMQPFVLPKVVFPEKLQDEFKQPPPKFDPDKQIPLAFWAFWGTDRSLWHENEYYTKRIYELVAQTVHCGTDQSRNTFCFALLRLIMSGQAGVYPMTDIDYDGLDDGIVPDCQVCLQANHPASSYVALFEPGNQEAVDHLAVGRYCAEKLTALQRLFHILNNIDGFKHPEGGVEADEKTMLAEATDDDDDVDTHRARLCMAHIEHAVKKCLEANAHYHHQHADDEEEYDDVSHEPDRAASRFPSLPLSVAGGGGARTVSALM